MSIVGGDGADAFSINVDGDVHVAQNILSYETKKEYTLQVKVEYGSTKIAYGAISISIKHVNKAPIWENGQVGVTKDSIGGTLVANLKDFGSDPDLDELVFSIVGGNASSDGIVYFSVQEWNLIVTQGVKLSFDEDVVIFVLEMLVEDPGGLNATGVLRIVVSGFSKLIFADSGKVLKVEENSAINTLVGDKLVAYDRVSRLEFFSPFNYLFLEREIID